MYTSSRFRPSKGTSQRQRTLVHIQWNSKEDQKKYLQSVVLTNQLMLILILKTKNVALIHVYEFRHTVQIMA